MYLIGNVTYRKNIIGNVTEPKILRPNSNFTEQRVNGSYL